MAAYSPPIPAPVKNRQRKKYQGADCERCRDGRHDVTANVNIISFLRPKRSVS
jgi:hypothetical protein